MEPDRPPPDPQTADALRRRQARNNRIFLVVLAALAVAIFTFILWRTAEAGAMAHDASMASPHRASFEARPPAGSLGPGTSGRAHTSG